MRNYRLNIAFWNLKTDLRVVECLKYLTLFFRQQRDWLLKHHTSWNLKNDIRCTLSLLKKKHTMSEHSAIYTAKCLQLRNLETNRNHFFNDFREKTHSWWDSKRSETKNPTIRCQNFSVYEVLQEYVFCSRVKNLHSWNIKKKLLKELFPITYQFWL